MFAQMKSLHTSLNNAHSGCKPSTSMSLSTHSFQVFLFLLLHLAPATSIFLQANTQSSTLQMSKPPQSATPRHIHHTPRRLYKSTLRFLSFSNTPHIHLTIIQFTYHIVFSMCISDTVHLNVVLLLLSVPSSQILQICFLHRPGLSPICQHTLDASLIYLSLYAV